MFCCLFGTPELSPFTLGGEMINLNEFPRDAPPYGEWGHYGHWHIAPTEQPDDVANINKARGWRRYLTERRWLKQRFELKVWA